jgi:hypothetical protein
MTNTPAKYRLTRTTEDGRLKRYVRVETVDGIYQLIDAHITLVAPNEGLISSNRDMGATAKHGKDSTEQFHDLASANSAANKLYDKYRGEGWEDLAEN